MRLRTRCAIAAAAAALCAALSGCGGSEADASDIASASPSPSPSPSPSATESADPYAFSSVPYGEYSDAARQTGIRPDLVAREVGFNAGLETLCRSTPTDLTALLATLKSAAAGEDNPGYGLQAMIDEVSLRLDMSCPQRMSDWIAAGGGSEHPGDEGFASETESGLDGTGVDGTGVDGTGVDGTGVAGTGVDGTGAPTGEPTAASTEPPEPSAAPSEEATESSFGQASIADLSSAEINDSGADVRQYDLGDDGAAGSGTGAPPEVEPAGAPAP